MNENKILGVNPRDLLEETFCKPNNEIRNLVKNLTKQYEKLQKVIKKKQEMYDNCSYKWQESNRGEEKYIEIQQLEGVAEGLWDTIESLKYYYKLN